MQMNVGATFRALSLACAVMALQSGLERAQAQDTSAWTPGNVEVLFELEPATLAQIIRNAPGSDLAATLSEATPEQRANLVALLSPADRTTLLVSLVQVGAEPELLADIASAVLAESATQTGDVIEQVIQNAAPQALPPLAAQLVSRIEAGCSAFSQETLTRMTLAALSFDTGTAEQIVQFGNATDAGCAGNLARSLVEITETASETIASAVEVALAMEGGAMARRVADLRGEVEVAAIPTPLPPAPVVPPAAIGGGGAAPGGAPGSGAGAGGIFAQNRGGAGLTRAQVAGGRPRIVSP